MGRAVLSYFFYMVIMVTINYLHRSNLVFDTVTKITNTFLAVVSSKVPCNEDIINKAKFFCSKDPVFFRLHAC